MACRSTGAKRDLIRLVRTPEQVVQIDATGKKAGRGAYLCRFGQCWEVGLQRRALDRALKMEISPENRDALAAFAAQLPRTPADIPHGGTER